MEKFSLFWKAKAYLIPVNPYPIYINCSHQKRWAEYCIALSTFHFTLYMTFQQLLENNLSWSCYSQKEWKYPNFCHSCMQYSCCSCAHQIMSSTLLVFNANFGFKPNYEVLAYAHIHDIMHSCIISMYYYMILSLLITWKGRSFNELNIHWNLSFLQRNRGNLKF